MQHIKNYMAKVDAMVESKMKETKTDKKGLLAPSKTPSDKKEKQSDLSIVAAYVASIRNARQEMKDA